MSTPVRMLRLSLAAFVAVGILSTTVILAIYEVLPPADASRIVVGVLALSVLLLKRTGSGPSDLGLAGLGVLSAELAGQAASVLAIVALATVATGCGGGTEAFRDTACAVVRATQTACRAVDVAANACEASYSGETGAEPGAVE